MLVSFHKNPQATLENRSYRSCVINSRNMKCLHRWWLLCFLYYLLLLCKCWCRSDETCSNENLQQNKRGLIHSLARHPKHLFWIAFCCFGLRLLLVICAAVISARKRMLSFSSFLKCFLWIHACANGRRIPMDSPCETSEDQVDPCLWGSESFWTYVDSNPSLFDGYLSDGDTEYKLAEVLCLSTEFKCLLSQKVSFFSMFGFDYNLL